MERTLSIIKPDGVSRGLIGDVIKHIEGRGLKIVAMKMLHLSLKQAQAWGFMPCTGNAVLRGLTTFMSSGPAVVMVLAGDNAIARWRDLMGATDFRKAAEGTIRRDFATDIEKNVVHGSDAEETAAFEIGYFFNRFEMVA
jgi:nucleoside-diphosphate kinase